MVPLTYEKWIVKEISPIQLQVECNWSTCNNIFFSFNFLVIVRMKKIPDVLTFLTTNGVQIGPLAFRAWRDHYLVDSNLLQVYSKARTSIREAASLAALIWPLQVATPIQTYGQSKIKGTSRSTVGTQKGKVE